MLLILPPSESKRPPLDEGPPLTLDELSFPTLTAMRGRILDAVVETSAGPGALRRLQVGPSLADVVARNLAIRMLPTRPAVDTYSGPLYEGLDAAGLSLAASVRARHSVVITSALWGVLRPGDRIPPYRLHLCSRLVGMDRLEPIWRAVLPSVLADAAGDRGLIVDLRSPSYQAIGTPAGLAHRTVTLRVARTGADGRPIGDVVAKRARGEAGRVLLQSGLDPAHPSEVVDILAERWPLELGRPTRLDASHTITLRIP